MWEKKAFYGLVSQACDLVPGFKKTNTKYRLIIESP